MVENNPNSSYYVKLNLKDTDGQNLDLRKLKNLKQTKSNEAIFKKYDEDGDGSLNAKESAQMAKDLQKAAGNGTLSKRELNKAFGTKGKELFNALRMLTYQQNVDFERYNEGGSVIDRKNNTVENEDGSVSHYDDNGKLKYISQEKKDNNGTSISLYKNNKMMIDNKPYSVTSEKDGIKEETTYDYGNNTKKQTIIGADGNKHEYEFNDINSEDWSKISTTEYEIVDGKKITKTKTTEISVREESGFVMLKDSVENYPDDPAKKEVIKYNRDDKGNVTSITKTKGQVTTTYASEKDMQNNKPSSISKNTGLDALDKTTTFTEKNGVRTGVEMNALGRASKVELTDKDGNKIQKMSIDVEKGDTFDNVISKIIEKYNLPKEDSFIRDKVKKALVAENYKEDGTGLCRQMKKGKYAGNYYFMAGNKAELSVENLNQILHDDASLTAVQPKITPEIKAPELPKNINISGLEDKLLEGSKEQIAKTISGMSNEDLISLGRTGKNKTILQQAALQLSANGQGEEAAKIQTHINDGLYDRMGQLENTLGDGLKVELNNDGQVIVKGRSGKILEAATNKAREILTPDPVKDEEDVNTMLKSDSSKNGTLEIEEYRNFMMNLFTQKGIEIPDDKKDKFEQLLQQSFNSIDNIKQDGSLTKEELLKNAAKALQQFEKELD